MLLYLLTSRSVTSINLSSFSVVYTIVYAYLSSLPQYVGRGEEEMHGEQRVDGS